MKYCSFVLGLSLLFSVVKNNVSSLFVANRIKYDCFITRPRPSNCSECHLAAGCHFEAISHLILSVLVSKVMKSSLSFGQAELLAKTEHLL